MELGAMKCPNCGGAPLVHATRDVPYIYKNEDTRIADVKGDFCDVCGEYVLDPTESRRVAQCMLAFNKQVDAKR
jgi:HTH-type transcriptional regulator/antitoxin MqsA